jgi:stringent starvation protein B
MEENILLSEAQAKPYLVRAICEWCADKDLTPYVAVHVGEGCKIPMDYVDANGDIVFNLSARTTGNLVVGENWITFAARFGGVSQDIEIPFTCVTAAFAKETGYGLFFHAQNVAPGAKSPSRPRPSLAEDATDGSEKNERAAESEPKTSHLKLVE